MSRDQVTKKQELCQFIDSEHGKGFCKNVDMSGWTFVRGDSFITFKLVKINNIQTAVIKYAYITCKKDLIKLLSFCINFWAGNEVKFIYMLEHKRQANYIKKYLCDTLGFTSLDEIRPGVWKHHFVSTNGFKEDNILEYYI